MRSLIVIYMLGEGRVFGESIIMNQMVVFLESYDVKELQSSQKAAMSLERERVLMLFENHLWEVC